MEEKNNEIKGKFSVGLGLFDYINPIFYTVTSIMLFLNLKSIMNKPLFIAYVIGAVLSLVFGFTIPTVKIIVGLGIMSFKMPVNLVFYVNSGIFISGLAIFGHVMKVSPAVLICIFAVVVLLLFLLYKKGKKFNTVAVLIGFAGYIMIYVSLITLAIAFGVKISILLYAVAICLFVMLVCIGIKADLLNAKIHWVIEISNVLCQGCVAMATVLLFKA